jgi:hypothetical protein
MLVDTRLVASLPQKGLTPDDAAVMAERAYIESMTSSPVPILFLRSQHVSQYGHDLKPRIYRVLLHPILCTKTTVCEQGDLLGPVDADERSTDAGRGSRSPVSAWWYTIGSITIGLTFLPP